jgi:hypothetical protein
MNAVLLPLPLACGNARVCVLLSSLCSLCAVIAKPAVGLSCVNPLPVRLPTVELKTAQGKGDHSSALDPGDKAKFNVRSQVHPPRPRALGGTDAMQSGVQEGLQ